MSASDPRYNFTILRAGRLLLDAGGMFGLIPRVVWSKHVATDELGRVELAHNCLLLERIDPPAGADHHSPRLILIEAGTGDKLDPKMAGVFGLDGKTIESAVIEAGRDPADIEGVIVSHLHFDHAGGLTRRTRANERPDWTADAPGAASGDAREVTLTFPRAEVVVQAREWRDASDNSSVMTRTYYPDHLLPLEIPLSGGRQRVRTVQSCLPFPAGLTPRRTDRPLGSALARSTEVYPGVRVFLTPGHTWGQQAVMFKDASGRAIVFTPDVMPTAWHVGQAYSLAYDVEPYTSMLTKTWLLEEAERNEWVLALDHEPGEPLRRVVKNAKGWYDLVAP